MNIKEVVKLTQNFISTAIEVLDAAEEAAELNDISLSAGLAA